jgi:hypothetical protein
MPYYEFELGLSGTGLSTAEWRIDCNDVQNIRAVVRVLINGMFADNDDEFSSLYLKVRGADGYIQWASKKIDRNRPDIDSCVFPTPFSEQ